ncbi:MAG: VIT domain-containing protein [Armatimonadota bacterium]
MKMRHSMQVSVAVMGLLAVCAVASADGMLIVRPRPEILKATPLPVKYHRVSVAIKDQVATTSIDQAFTNPHGRQLEAEYIFPLPEEAAISDFAMFMDGKRVAGALLDKDEARKTYEDIVRKMRDPALLEYVGRNMFKARVFPVPPKGDTRIQIEYSQVVPFDNHTCQYVYPLNTEKFSPTPLEEVSMAAVVESRIPIKSVYSPSHKVDETRDGDHKVTVGFEEKDVKPDKDFVLYYTLAEEDFGLGLVTHKEKGEDGHFLLLLAPQEEVQQREIEAKDVLFVFDKSGSMSGQKIEQAKRALKFCLNNLNAQDRFSLITFSTGVDMLSTKLLPAQEAKSEKAQGFIDEMKAVGGTNINEALTQALKMIEGGARPTIVVFLTDGLPTVGEVDEEEIVENVDKLNTITTTAEATIHRALYAPPAPDGYYNVVADEGAATRKARIFTFGVGNDVNTHLLDKVSGHNGGVTTYVQPEEDIEVKVSSLYEKLAHPVLSNVAVDFADIYVYDYYPQELPDLFKGSQLTVFGRYRGHGHLALELLGQVGGEDKRWAFDADFPEEEEGNDFIPRLWATRRIGYLLDQIRLKGENKELKEEIVHLSTTYGIMTPYTSYLVTEDSEAGGRRVPVLEASEAVRERLGEPQDRALVFGGAGGYGGGYAGSRGPQGAAGERGPAGPAYGYGMPGGAGWGTGRHYGDLDARTGAKAISGSLAIDGLKGEDTTVETAPGLVKHVAGETFYFDGHTWLHSDYKQGLPTYKIKAYGKAYFDLLAARPEWGKFFSLGEEVALVVEGKCVRVTAEGAETLSAAQIKEIASLGKKG